MNSDEKEQTVEQILRRYGNLGATVVSDNESLCRLLSTLKLNRTDRVIGEYLRSFLTV